jgi:hypothetical protein
VANQSTEREGRNPGPALLIAQGTHIPATSFYKVTIRLIPTAAAVALKESTTRADFGGGDGWVMA